jgi:diguanylate cyclase (GGDEF)-like protein/hemerythrin-like metal-binding protein/PAS domain S-box-containing protein
MTTLTRHSPATIERGGPSSVDDLAAALMKSALVPFAVVEGGHIVAASPALREILGGTSPYHHVDGRRLASIVAESDRATVDDFCAGLLANGVRAEQRCNLLHAGGTLVPVLLAGNTIAAEASRQIVLLVTDLTAWANDAAGSAAGPLAGAFDAATGFANRGLLLDRMKIALASARRHRRRAAVLRVDLERFEPLLEALGAEAAAEIEATVAETLRNCVRDSDTVARLNRHDFVLLLSEISERDDAGITAARVVAAVAALFERNDPERRVRAHIGVAVYPTDGTTSERLLQGADTALRAARSLRGGGFALADATSAELTVIEPLEFHAEYDTGVADIDAEHRTLMARTNALVHELKAGVDARKLESDVRAIAELLRGHFASEAHYLGTSPYEGAIDLKTRNLRFLDELDCILLHVNAQSILLAIRHLHDWLIPHLENVDFKRAS